MSMVTGETIAEAVFDQKYTPWVRLQVAGFLAISVVEIFMIPF